MVAQVIGSGAVRDTFADSFAYGRSCEDTFYNLVKAYKMDMVKATQKQDYLEHWDYAVKIGKDWRKIDVKGMKSVIRGDEVGVQDTLTAIELHGSAPRNKGWLYDGKADLLAFETEDSFVLVWRLALGQLMQNIVRRDVPARTSRDAVNGLVYNRRECEEVTWVATGMLRTPGILCTEWYK